MPFDKHSGAEIDDKGPGTGLRHYARDILAATLLTLAAALFLVIAMTGDKGEPQRAGSAIVAPATTISQN